MQVTGEESSPKLRSYWSRMRRFSFIPGTMVDGVGLCSGDGKTSEGAAWVMNVSRGSNGRTGAEGIHCLRR